MVLLLIGDAALEGRFAGHSLRGDECSDTNFMDHAFGRESLD
jgi:hypothetical protein